MFLANLFVVTGVIVLVVGISGTVVAAVTRDEHRRRTDPRTPEDR